MTIPLIAKLVKGFVGSGGLIDAVNVENNDDNQIGAFRGATDAQEVFDRLDATGTGADVVPITGAFSATNSNIDTWFGNKQLVRLRVTGRGSSPAGALPFDLPGTLALNAAFDVLQGLSIAQSITFIIEYTGDSSSFVSIRPRVSPAPQIMGTTSITVRSGVYARLEVTRTGGIISSYIWQGISPTASVAGGGGLLDGVTIVPRSEEVWDASETGVLPDTNVNRNKGYFVVNAPADGSGRFNESMRNGDVVMWFGETFTGWNVEPHQWGVISLHDIRAISALEQDFLMDMQMSAISDRNVVTRGANYADEAGEIRIKMYASGSYNAADLNTTGDIDEYTEASGLNGDLAVRLTGTQATLGATLDELYAYDDDGNNNFTLLGNLARDFQFQADHGSESDYVLPGVSYSANHTIRIYRGTIDERYFNQNLDISESNLLPAVQAKLNQSPDSPGHSQDLATLTAKVDTLYQLAPDIRKLTALAAIFDPSQTTQEVHILRGYSSMVDYRGDSTRYAQSGITYDNTGTDVVRYTGLTDGFFRLYGFKVTAPSAKTLLSLGSGATAIPLVDMTAAGNYRVNNYHLERTPGAVISNELHFVNRSAGDAVLNRGESNVSTFTITNFPTGSTNQSRTFNFDADVYINGTDTEAGHLTQIPVPAGNVAQSKATIDIAPFLGPEYHNRTVNVELSYVYRVDGSDLVVDIRLVSAPSDVTIAITSAYTSLSYTAADTTSRVDNWTTLTDFGSSYTFTGENELLLLFAPIVGGDPNVMEAVPVARAADGTVTQLNDANLAIPHVGLESIEIPDDIDFRTAFSDHYLRHSELAALVARTNTQWVYGLAELAVVSENRFTELVDFDQNIAMPSPDGTRYEVNVTDQGDVQADSK